MTRKQKEKIRENHKKLGIILKERRMDLTLEKTSRQFFIDDRVDKGLLPFDWISEKTLMNIEKGYNIPSLVTLKYLSVAFEINFIDLMTDIDEHILSEEELNMEI